MSRFVCYISESGSVAVCLKESMGETLIDCSDCEDKELHDKFIKGEIFEKIKKHLDSVTHPSEILIKDVIGDYNDIN